MAEYLGEEIDHCDQLVLLHGDALTVSTEQLGAELQYAREKFLPVSADAAKSKDIAHAFVKAKTVIGKTVEDLRYLRQQGLSYVNMGLETGCKELLSIAKPGQKLEDFSEAVIRLVSAGIRVSVNILAGLGGKKFEYRHVSETLNFLHMLPEEVTIFMAYLERKSDSKYVKKQEEELVPLEREELIKQAEAFKSGLHFRVYKYLFIPM
jgi:radical SAM superfamily enzyme YgiQ (UPF0313 family)